MVDFLNNAVQYYANNVICLLSLWNMLDSNSLTGLMASFFYDHRFLSIPGVGKLYLSEEAMPTMEESHHHAFPQGSITFVPNAREEADPELIGYITSRTRKIKALAIADVNSLADQAREMLNMRQSYSFPGIATLAPDLHGDIRVIPTIPSFTINTSRQNSKDRNVSEKAILSPNDQVVHSERPHRTFGGAIIGAVCVLIVAALVYFLFLAPESPDNKVSTQAEKSALSDPSAPGSHEPSHSSPKSEAPLSTTNEKVGKADSSHYEIVFEETDSARALRRYNQLTSWGHTIILHKGDSLHYTLAVPFNGPAADTAAAKDSIRVLYGHPVYIRDLSVR